MLVQIVPNVEASPCEVKSTLVFAEIHVGDIVTKVSVPFGRNVEIKLNAELISQSSCSGRDVPAELVGKLPQAIV